jgi:hypothetical protein
MLFVNRTLIRTIQWYMHVHMDQRILGNQRHAKSRDRACASPRATGGTKRTKCQRSRHQRAQWETLHPLRVLHQEGAGQSLRKTFSQPLYGGIGGHLKASEPADLSQAAICDEYTVGFTHTFTLTVELLE